MEQKIVNLLDGNKDLGGPVLPSERESLAKDLEKTPIDICREYAYALGLWIDERILLKSIVESAANPRLARLLINDLEDHLFVRLKTIVQHLICDMRDAEIKKIVEATLGIEKPSLEKEKKANELFNLVKSLNVDLCAEARLVAELARSIEKFSGLLYVCDQKDAEEQIRWRLSTISAEDLDMMLIIAKSRFANVAN